VLCEGYSQEMILIDKSTRLRQFRDQTEHTGCSSGGTQSEHGSAKIAGSVNLARQRAALGTPFSGTPSTDMSLCAYQSNIYLSFLNHRLFSDPYRDGTVGTFIPRVVEECTTSVVYTAVHCLATPLFERAHVLERSDVTH
jgi:hypothetical protein